MNGSSTTQKIPQLDAIRGIAILLVIGVHASTKYPSLHLEGLLGKGWMGVDLFFVLSGFLITGILLDTKQSDGFFTNFYARRCLRIWPLYYSVLFLMFAVIPRLRPSETAVIFAPRSSPWWAYLLYLQNFLIPVPTMATGPLGVMWSLAIEEQYYLIWPLIIRFCPRVVVQRIAISTICLSPLLRLYLAQHGVNVYSNFFCRLDGLMSGSLLAVLVRSRSFEPSKFLKPAWGLLFISTLAAMLVSQERNATWIIFSFTALASSALVYLAMFSGANWFQSVMTNSFLMYTGTISYGLYLLHKISFDVAQDLHLDRDPIVVLPAALLLTYGMAFVSWNLLEKPFLRLKRWFDVSADSSGTANGGFVLMSESKKSSMIA